VDTLRFEGFNCLNTIPVNWFVNPLDVYCPVTGYTLKDVNGVTPITPPEFVGITLTGSEISVAVTKLDTYRQLSYDFFVWTQH